MNRFLGFVKKEFMHIFRDIRTLVILFGIPAAQILIFGFAVRTDIKNAGIAVLDRSKDEISTGLVSRLESSDFFILKQSLESGAQIDPAFKKGDIKAVLIFEDNFGKRLLNEGSANIEIIADGSEPNVANLVTSYTRAIISDYMIDYNGAMAEGALVIEPEIKMYYNPNLESQYMFVPGVITIILVLICALMTSVAITREKEFGTMEVLLVSPLKPIHIILGKVTPYFILSLIDLIIILFLSWLVFDIPIKGSLVLLMLESMLYIMLGLSLGIMISTMSKTMQQAMFTSLLGLMLPTIILSGFIFPVEYMPGIYSWLSMIIPPRWFVTIIKDIMIKGTGFTFVWKETLILFIMTLVFITISTLKFKKRLE
ncbi:MAG TPA: multidrug ABC transporter permease [Bacteroidales bacterium]|nr:multidrug ABC transporter permease [Bacteroidales bacterium]